MGNKNQGRLKLFSDGLFTVLSAIFAFPEHSSSKIVHYPKLLAILSQPYKT